MNIEDDNRVTEPAPPMDGQESTPMRQFSSWVPIPGAPAWANEMDRRNHAERQLLFADNELMRREVRHLGKRLSIHDERLDVHDEQIARLKRRVADLQAENAELRGRLDGG